jgi:putative membrane protein
MEQSRSPARIREVSSVQGETLMKALLAAAAAVALISGCAPTANEAEVASVAVDPMAPTSAPGFMRMAASSDMFEIESSRMALQMSRNAQVRSYAQTMIDHHTRTTAEMNALAQQAGLAPPPPQMMPNHLAALDRLRATAPADFDAAYKREQITSHQEALNLHRTYAAQGDLAPFRDFAGRTAPIVESHLNQAQTLPDYAPPPPPAPARAGERG